MMNVSTHTIRVTVEVINGAKTRTVQHSVLEMDLIKEALGFGEYECKLGDGYGIELEPKFKVTAQQQNGFWDAVKEAALHITKESSSLPPDV